MLGVKPAGDIRTNLTNLNCCSFSFVNKTLHSSLPCCFLGFESCCLTECGPAAARADSLTRRNNRTSRIFWQTFCGSDFLDVNRRSLCFDMSVESVVLMPRALRKPPTEQSDGRSGYVALLHAAITMDYLCCERSARLPFDRAPFAIGAKRIMGITESKKQQGRSAADFFGPGSTARRLAAWASSNWLEKEVAATLYDFCNLTGKILRYSDAYQNCLTRGLPGGVHDVGGSRSDVTRLRTK